MAAWSVLSIPGLTLDSIGTYLAALGLLQIAARKWHAVRGCWKNDHFVLIHGPSNEDELQTFLSNVAEQCTWSSYEKTWDKFQKADTKSQGSTNSAMWRAREATEAVLPLYHSHLALGHKLSFNPLFGTGGNAGKRDFSKGWDRATTALQKPPRGWSREALLNDLSAFLRGESCACLADYNAACWFSAANKAFNSGTAKPFRDGQITPWAMALACEAFPLLRGDASRLLGSQRRATGAFPFITAPAAPEAAGEAGRSIGEAWLPVWTRPMTPAELEMMFARGRAEVNGRGAVTPPAFAAAITQRGIDAGIDEFRRFILLRTTSENTFESRLADIIPCKDPIERHRAKAVATVLALRDALPPDTKKGQRWIFAGLRGSLDRTLIEYAASPTPERARSVVDAAIVALRKVDRNRSHRARKLRFSPLPTEWLSEFCGSDSTPEMRLALATASLKAASDAPPLLAYLLGVKQHWDGGWWIPENVPFQRVWGSASLTRNLAAIIQRRLVDHENPVDAPPFRAPLFTSLADAELWLRGELDEMEFERWLFRFSLFDLKDAQVTTAPHLLTESQPFSIGSEAALFSLFKPLFAPQVFTEAMRNIPHRRSPRCATVTRLASLLSRGDLSTALSVARSTWHTAGVSLADWKKHFETPTTAEFAERLLAAMLLPVRASEVVHSFRRWLLPSNPNKPMS